MQKWYLDDIPLHQQRVTNSYVVPEEELIAFAKRWDPQAIHIDGEAARQSPHRGLIAPAAYTFAVATSLVGEFEPKIAVIAAADWRGQFTAPVRPGDCLVATWEYVHKRASSTKTDRGIARLVSTLRNQKGEAVLVWESNVVVSKST